MKQFPTIQINSDKDVNSRTINMLQDRIVQALNPVLAKELNDSNFLQDISLVSGTNIVNHGLARNLLGWFIVRKNNFETICDLQDANPTPSKTLQLFSSGSTTVSLIVF